MLLINRRDGEGVVVGDQELIMVEVAAGRVSALLRPVDGDEGTVVNLAKGERCELGPMAYVMLVEVTRDRKARLVLDAPKHVPIHRREVYDAIHGVLRPPG